RHLHGPDRGPLVLPGRRCGWPRQSQATCPRRPCYHPDWGAIPFVQDAMTRRTKFSLSVAALALLCAADPAAVQAQQAPTDRDLAVYAGLHAAAASGDVAEIERLIAEGERPNIQDANSRTPLLVAAFRKHHEAVRALLKLGANPNARDMQGFDILTLAAVNNDLELLRIALAGGADPRRVTGP